jgi:hypothetical protein
MFQRLLISAAAIVASIVVGGIYAAAEDQVGTHEGLVVSVEGNKLNMSDKEGKNQHSHTVPADAAITCDGKACRLQDLKKGYPVKVTIEKKAQKNVVTRIDAQKRGP